MKSIVALVRCDSYDEPDVGRAVRKGIDLLGGPAAFVRRGEKILLKPNLLAGDPPEKCSCTHPTVFKAVCEILLCAGGKLTYGDSPGFQRPDIVAQKTGFAEIAEKLSVAEADFRTGSEVFYKNGIQNKKFTIAKGILESDSVVSLPKLKAHGFLLYTGAIKNQFGCIPGVAKGEFHVRTPDASEFAKMLCDLNGFVNPKLYVMDAIMAMEGNGPRNGNPKKLGVLLFSTDPVALDATACRIIGLDPTLVYTNTAGFEAGLGTYKEESIAIAGDPIKNFIDTTFDVQREVVRLRGKSPLFAFAKNALLPKPVIDRKLCVKCGACVSVCPVSPKALDWLSGNKRRPPTYTYRRCIRCYCCQELCPHGAIFIKTPLIRKIILKPKTEKISKQ